MSPCPELLNAFKWYQILHVNAEHNSIPYFQCSTKISNDVSRQHNTSVHLVMYRILTLKVHVSSDYY